MSDICYMADAASNDSGASSDTATTSWLIVLHDCHVIDIVSN